VTTSEADDDQETTEVTLAYSTFDSESDGFETARDLRCDMITPDEIGDVDAVYDERVTFDVPATVDEYRDVTAFLEVVYKALEHNKVDDVDRTEYRSPMKGDVFAVDGTAYTVASIGFDALETPADTFA
jgi:hypothetical protein